jgi:ankyrin repeat protein
MDQLQYEFAFCATLAAASEVGDFPLVKSLLALSHHTKPNGLGYALTQAISANRTDVGLLLLDAGASTDRNWNMRVYGFTNTHSSFNDEQYQSTYLLQTACRNRNAVLVQALLDHDASVFEYHGTSPLEAAAEWGDRTIIKSIITAGSVDRWDNSDRSVSIAVEKKDYECVRLLLQSSVLVCELSLVNAVRNSDEQMVRELLMYGACSADSYALIAAMESAPALFSLLVCETRRRYPQGTSECTKAILAAVGKGQTETVQTLLQCIGGNRMRKVGPEYGEMLSPLAAAIRRDGGTDVMMVQTILQAGVDLDDLVAIYPRRTTSGSMLPQETGLLVAIGTKQLEMVRLLLAWGASVDLPAEQGLKRTPLQKAAEMGSIPIVKLLLNQGADVNANPAARGGGTAVQFAAIGGYIGVVELLCSYGAEVTAPGSKVYGRSAIEGAAENGRFDMVKYLVDLGPQITSQLEGAINLAKSQGHDAIVEVLEPVLLETKGLPQCQEHGFIPEAEHFDLVGMPATLDFGLEDRVVTAQISTAEAEQDVFTSSTAVTNTKGQRLFCDRCSKSFSKASALKRYRKTIHAARDRQQRVECPICSQLFARQDIMRRHRATHDQSAGYEQCGNCLNKFRKDYLRSKHSKRCK